MVQLTSMAEVYDRAAMKHHADRMRMHADHATSAMNALLAECEALNIPPMPKVTAR